MLRRQLTSKSTKRAKSKPFQNGILKKKIPKEGKTDISVETYQFRRYYFRDFGDVLAKSQNAREIKKIWPSRK